MNFTTEELEMIALALGLYEDSWCCGEDDMKEYWKKVLELARRIENEAIDRRIEADLTANGI